MSLVGVIASQGSLLVSSSSRCSGTDWVWCGKCATDSRNVDERLIGGPSGSVILLVIVCVRADGLQ